MQSRNLNLFSTKQSGSYYTNYYSIANILAQIPSIFKIKRIHFDLAGTLVDPFCLAPLYAFADVFMQHGFQLSREQITDPMGLNKIAHIRQLLHELREPWQTKYGRYPNEDDVQTLYQAFLKVLAVHIAKFTDFTPYTIKMLHFLLENNIETALTTGYPREAAQILIDKIKDKSVLPYAEIHADTTSDEVTHNTRAEMIDFNNQKLRMDNIDLSQIAFATDALNDILNVKHSKNPVWIIGVSGFSTHLNSASGNNLSESELRKNREAVEEKMKTAGAHIVIRTLDDMPRAMLTLSLALKLGKSPKSTGYIPLLTEDEFLQQMQFYGGLQDPLPLRARM